MKRVAFLSSFVLLLFVTHVGIFSARAQNKIAETTLKVGEEAPDFTLPSNQHTTVKLSDYRGKKNVVLAFYVLAFTGGWTKELQAYQDGIAKGKIDTSDTEVLGLSIDSPAANEAFAKQIGVTFPLLSDMNRKVLSAYGILKMYDMKTDKYELARRTTIIVDKQGRIQHIEFDNSAVDPTTAMAVCTKLQKKSETK